MWIVFAILSAIFAALTSILAKVGIEGVNSNLATAIRTVVVVAMSWGMVFLTNSQNDITEISRKSWIFLILSGLATGASWLCYYKALQIGDASKVVPIDKLSVEKQDLIEIKNDKFAMNRFALCREFREKSTKEGTRKCADTPYLFQEIRQPNKDFVVLPVTTSEQRKYIPIGYLNKEIICSNALMIIPDADIYHFGVLISNVHMAWMRAFTGRLEMRYQYSASVVYNNFPWCNPTDEQKRKIEQTAQAILEARKLYPNCSLSDLYGAEMWLYPELLEAHRNNDRAVMQAYGFDVKTMTESSCVTSLVQMYLSKNEELFGDLMNQLSNKKKSK